MNSEQSTSFDSLIKNAIQKVLHEARTIAVVGLSPSPDRPSHRVASYLQTHGYRVVPVNPRATSILGEVCHPSLSAIGETIDLVNVFRNPEDCPEIARQAVSVGAKALWLQLGIVSNEAAQIAEAGGLIAIMDRCTMVEHARMSEFDL